MGAVDCVLKCFGPLLRFVEGPWDTVDDRLRKTLLVPLSCVGIFILSSYIGLSVSRGACISVFTASIELAMVVCFLAYVMVTKKCSQRDAGMLASVYGTISILSDIYTYGLVEYYTSAVLVMDVLLLCNCHRYFTHWIFVVTIVVIFVSWMEQVYGALGIYDAIPEEWTGYDRPAKTATKVACNLLIQRYNIFILDFAMTRYFSKGMREQREQVERSVVVAQQIASALARFDLEKAEAMVLAAEGLPLELLDALSCLLGNLRSYKPYLPQSCLRAALDDANDDDDEGDLRLFKVVSLDSSVASDLSSTRELTAPAAPTRRTVSLVQVNIHRFMDVVEAEGTSFAEYHAVYIGAVLDSAKATKGLVEHFLCDRVLVSFNATKQCASHRLQALVCAEILEEFDPDRVATGASLSIAITSSEVFSGPLGCDGLRSYSLVGMAASWAPVLERIAVQLSVTAITDTTVQRHTHEHSELRMLGRARFEKDPEQELELFEFMKLKRVVEEEWMYQLEQGDSWEAYNTARRLLCEGDVAGACQLATAFRTRDGYHVRLAEEIERRASQPRGLLWRITDVGIREEHLPRAGLEP